MDIIKNFSNMALSVIANEGLIWNDIGLDKQYHSLSYSVLSMCNQYEPCNIEDIHKFAIEELDRRMSNIIK